MPILIESRYVQIIRFFKSNTPVTQISLKTKVDGGG